MSKLRSCLLAIIVVLVGALLTPQAAGQGPDDPIMDPIPQDPVVSPLALTVKEFASLPKSDPTPATTDPRIKRWNRINYLGEVPDGSGRSYVPDLNGKLYLVKDGKATPYLDLATTFAPNFLSGSGIGSGFGFVAFHPDFAHNGKFYTVHSESVGATQTGKPDLVAQTPTGSHGVIDEWTADDPSADTFTGTHREVLRLGYRSFVHTIQQIQFNPSAKPGDEDYGLLYVAAGDGAAGTASTDAQVLSKPHGKVLRIDPLGTNSANGKYGIPASNPFVDQAGALGEIYAYGLRNPHRFSWDPQGRPGQHRMFLGMIGEHNVESIFEVKAGDNFGWEEREGPFLVKDRDPTCSVYPLPEDDAKFGYTYPVAAYDHDRPPGTPPCQDSGDAVIGGFVYRGTDAPALRGKYVFGDDVNGHLFYTETSQMRRGTGKLAKIHELTLLNDEGKQITMQDLVGDTRVDLRFGQDASGEIYLLSKSNGKIYRITGARDVRRLRDVHPGLRRDLAAYYDFEHPVVGSPIREQDQGSSGSDISLINGGANMRVADGAYPGSTHSVQTQQVNPTVSGNDDWKAGRFREAGLPTLNAFNGVRGTTIMGWFKMTGENPSRNSTTANPNDFFGAVGLAGILSGDSNGHDVRALLEVIDVSGELRVVALGRRIDGGNSQTFAASADWHSILPNDEWVFLAATFDFDKGTMALYKNGQALPGFRTVAGDPWDLSGSGPHASSGTDPKGIKIGGSFPQNTLERNPCNCRMDGLMFLDRTISADEVANQYRWATTRRP